MALLLSLLALLLLSPIAHAQQRSLGALQSLSCGSVCNLTVSVAGGGGATVPLQLSFWGPSIVRWWLAVDGNFSDTGAASDVIVTPSQAITISAVETQDYYELQQTPPASVFVRVGKAPVLLTIFVDGKAVVTEQAPLTWNGTSSWETLSRDGASGSNLTVEHFFGGGMQNGRFAHRDQTIGIGVDYDWDEGGHPNSAPWYVSTAGYGVLRNTWAPGAYSFASPVVTVHNESTRFDAFFLLAGAGPDSIKTLLGMYANLTGPPFLPPIYGLFLGDSDCYHNSRHGNSTQVALAVARQYKENDIPGGWLLVNDGYGCVSEAGWPGWAAGEHNSVTQ